MEEVHIFLGAIPCEDDGAPSGYCSAKVECDAWRSQLLQQWQEAHEGNDPPFQLEVAEQNHDFGVYYAVVAIATNELELEAALWLEAHADTKWHANWEPALRSLDRPAPLQA